ncbi:MAG: ATP-binding protein [Bdellovibrionota bacterium]
MTEATTKSTASASQGRRLQLAIETTAQAVEKSVLELLSFLRSHIPDLKESAYELALSEVLRNAFEHGNLGISGREKASMCEAGTFDSEVERRSNEAVRLGKRILVTAEVSSSFVSFEILDQGAGFDWRVMPDPIRDPDAREQLSGRGIFLIQQFFDDIEYNEQGNCVKLKKRLNGLE